MFLLIIKIIKKYKKKYIKKSKKLKKKVSIPVFLSGTQSLFCLKNYIFPNYIVIKFIYILNKTNSVKNLLESFLPRTEEEREKSLFGVPKSIYIQSVVLRAGKITITRISILLFLLN